MGRPRLLLTGATGFVGRQVLEHLGPAYDVHCTSRQMQRADDAAWHQVDLRDPDTCRQLIADIRPDILIHAAWNTEHGIFWEADDNADWLHAGRALFSAFADYGGARVIGCGSCAEYAGESSEPRRESEDQSGAEPATSYGRAKLALFQHLRTLRVEHAWARIFLAYGRGEDQRRLVPSIARALLRGEPAACSSGRQLRDFIDVRELGRAVAMLASSSVTGSINLGQGEECSIADVAMLLGNIAGRPDLIRLGALPDRAGEPQRLVPDLTRQRDELGFAPEITLRQGLCDVLKSTATQLDIP
jgi:nucleoside-diphosphate-sugar epimerase